MVLMPKPLYTIEIRDQISGRVIFTKANLPVEHVAEFAALAGQAQALVGAATAAKRSVGTIPGRD